jgi:hypothetical protein
MTASNDDYVFRPEDLRVIGIALEAVLAKLGLAARSDEDAKEAASIVANEILAMAGAGERNPEILCAGVLESLRRDGEAIPRRN